MQVRNTPSSRFHDDNSFNLRSSDKRAYIACELRSLLCLSDPSTVPIPEMLTAARFTENFDPTLRMIPLWCLSNLRPIDK